MKRLIKKASTDVTVEIFIQDSSSTTGAGLTGLVFNSAGLACYYVRPLTAAAALSLVTQTVTGAHSDGGFVEIDATNMPGAYRLDLSDAVVATGKDNVTIMLEGATNMAPVLLEIQLTDIDVNDAVRAGLTALPNAAADAAGGLVISDAGGLDIDAMAGDVVNLDGAAMRGTDNAATASALSTHDGKLDTVDTNIDTLLDALIMQATTIATLASQVSFTLSAGSTDDDAYNGAAIVIVDASTGVQKAFGSISDYTGSTKTVTLAQDPGIFTMATTDKVYILSSDTFAIIDRVLTGSTHNVNNSLGKRIRELGGIVMSSGTAQAGGVNTITLAAGESATDNIFRQSYIAIIGGTGVGQGHHVLSYNGATKVAIMDDDWVIQPDATSEYVIYGAGSHDSLMSGLAQAGSASTITLESTASADDNLIKDAFVVVVSGTGAHQTRRITDYNGTTKIATVIPDWEINPDATSGYWIAPQGSTNVWDEPLTGALHNEANSSGRRLRELSTTIAYSGSVNDAGATTTSFDIDAGASAVDDFYVDQTFIFTDGALAGQSRAVLTYVGATRTVTFDEALTSAPANGVGIQIMADHVHPVSQIADGVHDEPTSEHTTAGSAGKVLNDLGPAATTVVKGTATGTPTATTMAASALTEDTDDHYNGRIIIWTSGVLKDQATDITDYDGATNTFTFTATTEAATAGDTFVIV